MGFCESKSNLTIINEVSDAKGTIDDEVIIEYIEKAKYSTCKIEIDDNKYGSGFFCKIPFQEDENILINVLLTNEHVLEYDDVFSEKDIKLIVNNEKKIISLKKQRKRWSSKELDYSCIEILKEDKIQDFYMLDDKILKNDYSNDIYLNKSIFVFGIMKNKKRGHSDGLITSIDQFYFVHNCNTDKGCSGAVIVNKNNNLVIGIHKGELVDDDNKNKNKILNVGIFIKNIIEDIIRFKQEKLIKEPLNNKKKKQIIAVRFKSFEHYINQAILCKTNDKFSVVENKLYNEYPEIRNKNCLFIHNGSIIDNKEMTLGEYGIKNGDNIITHFSNNGEITKSNINGINPEYIVVHFISTRQDIDYALVCKINDKFSDVENRLYNKYPEIIHKCFFIYNGNSIYNKEMTLGEYDFQSGDKILVDYLDDY